MLLTLLALAAPLPAFAISDQALQPVSVAPSPAALVVSTSLDSCGVLENQIVCKLDVSFNPLPNADSYSATVSSADGSVVDYGGVGAGGTSLWVPYVGAGTYSVKITAYGQPVTSTDSADGTGDVIATAVSRSSSGGRGGKPRLAPRRADEATAAAATEVSGRTPGGSEENADPDGAASTGVESSPAAPDPACTTTPTTPAPPTPPEEPPADTDPENPDEDGDGISDEQERATYEQDLAAYQAALDAYNAQQPPAPAC